MTRNSTALIAAVREVVSSDSKALRAEERKLEWILEWRGVDSTTFPGEEPQITTWENVEELSSLKWDCEARICSLEGRLEEGKELLTRLNAFF
jgi:hypothetical protein